MALIPMRLFRWVIFVAVAASAVQWLISHKSYTFSPREIRRIAELHAGQHPKESGFKISNELRRKYHPHIIPDAEQVWHSSNFGGMSHKFLLLHVSLTELLVMYGSPLRMSGGLGSHWYNESCSVLSGSLHAFRSGSLQLREEYGPGEFYRHMMGETVYVESSEETWLLCYARGFVPASLPLFVASNVVGGGDVVSPAKALASIATSMAREAAYSMSETFQGLVKKFGLGGK